MTKDHILREIRRSGATNGEIPLAKGDFPARPASSKSDWRKCWALWSDAVRKSGLEPNTLQNAYNEQVLLQEYAQFVRELGRIQTNSEMRFKAYSDPKFSGRAIEARLGPKAKLMRRVVERFAKAFRLGLGLN